MVTGMSQDVESAILDFLFRIYISKPYLLTNPVRDHVTKFSHDSPGYCLSTKNLVVSRKFYPYELFWPEKTFLLKFSNFTTKCASGKIAEFFAF